MTDHIATIEIYRGVGIHDCQPRDRIEAVVRPMVDVVLAMSDVADLVRFAGDIAQPPEARLLAAAKCEAAQQIAAAGRVERPNVDLTLVRAMVAGLSSRRWRSPRGYGSALDTPPAPGDSGHQPRPPEYGRQVEEDGQRAREEERAERRPAPLLEEQPE
jgi:hypothetical protein